MNRNGIVVIVVMAAVAFMLFAGVRMARPKAGVVKLKPVGKNGSAAPDFELQSLDHKPVRLSDFRGKAVLLNFWATWCAPCKIEMPWFVDLQKKYASQGLQVVGVAMDDSGEETIAKFAREMSVNYPVLIGKEAVGDAYGGVEFLPTTFIIDREGKVVDRIFGLAGRSEFEDNIKKALGPGASPTQARIPSTSEKEMAR